MGCGAGCQSSAISDPLRVSSTEVLRLIESLTPCSGLLSKNELAQFVEDFHSGRHRYLVVMPSTLSSNEMLPSTVLLKWRTLLLGHDNEMALFVETVNASETEKQIYPHSCFAQIEKDIDRTFQHQNLDLKQFERVLNRIANQFPKMGYTQGINFIVGYLLILGYSEVDTFAIFCRLSVGRRFLLLGMFEDGFPLTSVYLGLFRSLLRRANGNLYVHLYENLEVSEMSWVFKWFTTYYLYSFPLELCGYIWDFLIEKGSTGLVIFAVALTMQLAPQILAEEDPNEIVTLFSSLKNLEQFNSLIDIHLLFIRIASLSCELEDFIEKNQSEGSFYYRFLLEQYGASREKENSSKDPLASTKDSASKPASPDQNEGQPSVDQPIYQQGQLPLELNQASKQASWLSQLSTRGIIILEGWYRQLIEQRKAFLGTFKLTSVKMPVLLDGFPRVDYIVIEPEMLASYSPRANRQKTSNSSVRKARQKETIVKKLESPKNVKKAMPIIDSIDQLKLSLTSSANNSIQLHNRQSGSAKAESRPTIKSKVEQGKKVKDSQIKRSALASAGEATIGAAWITPAFPKDIKAKQSKNSQFRDKKHTGISNGSQKIRNSTLKLNLNSNALGYKTEAASNKSASDSQASRDLTSAMQSMGNSNYQDTSIEEAQTEHESVSNRSVNQAHCVPARTRHSTVQDLTPSTESEYVHPLPVINITTGSTVLSQSNKFKRKLDSQIQSVTEIQMFDLKERPTMFKKKNRVSSRITPGVAKVVPQRLPVETAIGPPLQTINGHDQESYDSVLVMENEPDMLSINASSSVFSSEESSCRV